MAATVLAELRTRLYATMARLVPRGSRVAILGFPNHGNVGDTAIWLGTLVTLAALGCRLTYVSTHVTFSERRLRRRLSPDGIVILHGGGNFGDLWPIPHDHRERVTVSLRDYRLLQMPQSVLFRDPARQAESARLLRAHPRLKVLARDQRSLQVARDQMGLDAELCPDAAVALAGLPAVRPARDCVWISRTDQEAPGGKAQVDEHGNAVVRVDWIAEEWTNLNRLAARCQLYPWVPDGAAIEVYNALARRRLERGCRLITSGRVLVTNRLHGQVLAMLLGVPHFISDTRQGKVGDYYRTWLADRLPEIWNESEDEAVGRAIALARTMG
jgi:pyruvyl transferase EpsO